MSQETKKIVNDFMEGLLKQQGFQFPKVGEIIDGKVIIQEGNIVYVDLGNFHTGIIYGQEFYTAKETIKNLNPGDTIAAKVTNLENDDGYVELSLSQAGISLGWQKIASLKEEKIVLNAKIEEANRGGLLTTIEGQKAFLPVSQLSNEHYPRIDEADKNKILEELNKFVGIELQVRVIDIDASNNKLIISERASQDELMQNILAKYKVDDIIEGEISGVTNFGAFVKFLHKNSNSEDIPLEGLVHISELDWQLIEDPRDIVKVGDKVKVKIISIEAGRISLSLKALKKDSWADIEKKYKKGDFVSGTLMKLNPFGAFIKLNENIHGLAHISEFGSEKKMKETLQSGKQYKFEIISIEPKEHRMSLKFADPVEK